MILRNLLAFFVFIQYHSPVHSLESWPTLRLAAKAKENQEVRSEPSLEYKFNTRKHRKKKTPELIQPNKRQQQDDIFDDPYWQQEDDINNDDTYNYNDDYFQNIMDKSVKDYVVDSLLRERPTKYSFHDILPRSITRLIMYNPDPPNTMLGWFLVANDHRCLGGYQYKLSSIEFCYGEKALTCKELKSPPKSMPGYETFNSSLSNLDELKFSFHGLINNDPNKYKFMEDYLPTFEMTSLVQITDENHETNNDYYYYGNGNEEIDDDPFISESNYYPNYRVDMTIYSADGLNRLGSFTCDTDGYSKVEWGDEY